MALANEGRQSYLMKSKEKRETRNGKQQSVQESIEQDERISLEGERRYSIFAKIDDR